MSTPCSLSRCRTTAMPLPGAPRELSSDDSDVLGFLALPAWGHVELDALAVFERPVAIALNRREVDEYVVPAFTLDEAEALLRVEPFHSALRCHVVCFPWLSSRRAGVSSRQAGHVFSIHSVASGGAKRTAISLGRTEIPGTLPARRERRERWSNRCCRIRAAPRRPKLTSKGYQTDVYAQFTLGGRAR